MIFQPVRAGTGITGKKTIIKQTFWSFWKGNLQLDSLPQLWQFLLSRIGGSRREVGSGKDLFGWSMRPTGYLSLDSRQSRMELRNINHLIRTDGSKDMFVSVYWPLWLKLSGALLKWDILSTVVLRAVIRLRRSDCHFLTSYAQNSLLSALYLGSMPRGPLKLNSVLMISLVEPLISRRTLNRELVKGVDFTMSKLLCVLILLCFGRLLVFL